MLIVALLSFVGITMGDTRTAQVVDSAPFQQVAAKEGRMSIRNFDAARCKALADLSQKEAPTFTQMPSGEWECNSLLEFPETGRTPSLFIQIRGNKDGRWTYFRLKLNFGSSLSRQTLSERAVSIIHLLIGERTSTTDLATSLAAGQEFESTIAGAKVRYKQEGMDKSRFNFFGTNSPGYSKGIAE
ncbi:DUF6030 family protein [Agrobacterium sp. SORGH_AS 787]|uniref:DUF6030 family protein n=1 Tax=Agrobacterium sp. SORGH_AS 787 TaxID=3041775 RepID=UPI0027811EB2|nr:hypothetical protein [Rhizobium sp. SORGH_AS_0787]